MALPLLYVDGDYLRHLDGDPKWVDVSALYPVGDEFDAETHGFELRVKLTSEGVIVDLINAAGEIIGTRGWTAEELWEILFDQCEG